MSHDDILSFDAHAVLCSIRYVIGESARIVLSNTILNGTVPSQVCELRAGVLSDLVVDCFGGDPEVDCPVPTCCSECFQ